MTRRRRAVDRRPNAFAALWRHIDIASDEFTLAPVPPERRERDLWLQHAAGFVLFEDVRNYARDEVSADLWRLQI